MSDIAKIPRGEVRYSGAREIRNATVRARCSEMRDKAFHLQRCGRQITFETWPTCEADASDAVALQFRSLDKSSGSYLHSIKRG